MKSEHKKNNIMAVILAVLSVSTAAQAFDFAELAAGWLDDRRQ